ncbi:MAG TPA: DNA-3-methyladenine glycosylase [Verrucomicrobiae bacterium]|nr:DNA-3-methyladenine glycosylase [Verrucomicrobiae bacterium]
MGALQNPFTSLQGLEQAIGHLRTKDKTLARLIRRVGPCRLCTDNRRSPFESLVEAVAHQQLHGKAARTILGRVKALVPNRRFPSPDDLLHLPEDSLRGAGLSRAKVAAVKDIAAKTRDRIVPTARQMAHMDDAEIVERLTTIRGVGRWTVEMLLIFKLGRLDVLPIDDFGVRKGFAITYRHEDLPRPKALLDYGERWRPFRSVAAWYLWRAVDESNQ